MISELRYGLEMVKWLLDHGANRDSRGELDFTPLMIARQGGNNDKIVDILQNYTPRQKKTKRRKKCKTLDLGGQLDDKAAARQD